MCVGKSESTKQINSTFSFLFSFLVFSRSRGVVAIVGKQVPDLGRERSLARRPAPVELLVAEFGAAAVDPAVLGPLVRLVVELERVIDGLRHLHLHLLIFLALGVQSLALDPHGLLQALVVLRRPPRDLWSPLAVTARQAQEACAAPVS